MRIFDTIHTRAYRLNAANIPENHTVKHTRLSRSAPGTATKQILGDTTRRPITSISAPNSMTKRKSNVAVKDSASLTPKRSFTSSSTPQKNRQLKSALKSKHAQNVSSTAATAEHFSTPSGASGIQQTYNDIMAVNNSLLSKNSMLGRVAQPTDVNDTSILSKYANAFNINNDAFGSYPTQTPAAPAVSSAGKPPLYPTPKVVHTETSLNPEFKTNGAITEVLVSRKPKQQQIVNIGKKTSKSGKGGKKISKKAGNKAPNIVGRVLYRPIPSPSSTFGTASRL